MITSYQLANLDKPTDFDLESLENFSRTQKPLAVHETYFACGSDMVSLKAGRDDAWLDRVIFKLLVRLNSAPLRVSMISAVFCHCIQGY